MTNYSIKRMKKLQLAVNWAEKDVGIPVSKMRIAFTKRTRKVFLLGV